MSFLHLLILAILQGITEFLPVSSSGHLAVLPLFMDWRDQGLLIDVAVHLGTLFAVIIYFRSEVAQILKGALTTLGFSKKPTGDWEGRLFQFVFLASLPVLAFGALMAFTGHGELFRDPLIIALGSIGFGLLLFGADKFAPRKKRLEDLNYRSSLIIGLYQVLALIPGTSRSGITMTAGRFLGFERVEAARFSMLLSIPTILAAGGWSALELLKTGTDEALLSAILAAGFAFATALLAIHFLIRWLERSTMTIFVVYRVIFGVIILAVLI